MNKNNHGMTIYKIEWTGGGLDGFNGIGRWASESGFGLHSESYPSVGLVF